MDTKAFEIRDSGTFIPVIATLMHSVHEQENYLLRRIGFGPHPLVLVCRMDAQGNKDAACYDPHQWDPSARTLHVAHAFIERAWYTLASGDVIDVEFILGETTKAKVSERFISV